MRLGARDGVTLGKCQWCNRKVTEGDKEPFALFARIINTKWYCGDCIFSIKPLVDEIAEGYEAAIDISEAVGNPLRLDPKTGRLVRT